MTLGERIAVMNAAGCSSSVRPTEVYGGPANLFVAAFIGTPSMNLVSPADAGLTGLPPGDPKVGLRPEALTPAGGDPSNAIEITVDLVEPLGNETVVHGSLASGGKVIARLGPRILPSPGERMRLAYDRGDVLLFDSVSGERITA